jgi:hypothetical protein
MGRMLLGWWLEFFVNVQKLSQLQNLQRVHGRGPQARCHTIGKLVVLLQSGVKELKQITSRCAEAAPLSWRPLSYPGQARDVASWP